MSKGVNKWIGIGNCCADPEVRYLPSGGSVANLTIACNESYKNKETGEKVDKTEFVRIVFFNKLAEIAGEYLKKGSKVYIGWPRIMYNQRNIETLPPSFLVLICPANLRSN